jgi:hypothetical protein
MFLTQIYGTVLGGFINYAVMISIIGGNADLLTSGNGDSSWSGATIQSYNTNASSWALAKYLYKSGGTYSAVPIGLAVGAGIVVVHRLFVQVCSVVPDPVVSLANRHYSLYQGFATFQLTTSTCLNSCNTPVTFPTTNRRLVSS